MMMFIVYDLSQTKKNNVKQNDYKNLRAKKENCFDYEIGQDVCTSFCLHVAFI